MGKLRDLVRMSEAEIAAFIASQKSLQVATISADGSPHLSTLWFALINGDIVFETYAKSQKVKNLERDQRITVLCEDGDTYETLRGVMIKGTATLVRDYDEVVKLAEAVISRNTPEVPADQLKAAAAQLSAKRVAVIVTANQTASWDHTKLGNSQPYAARPESTS